MPLVGESVYRCFESCSFIPFFDSEPLDELNDRCICEHYRLPPPPLLSTTMAGVTQPMTSSSTRRPITPSSSSTSRRPTRGKSGGSKSGGSKSKNVRAPSMASLLDIGFGEWAPSHVIEHGSAKKQPCRTGTRGAASRRKSDRNAPSSLQTDYTSDSLKPGQKDYPTFRFYEDTTRYMSEYRARCVQKLVGYDGSTAPEALTMGENLPDPYVFKTAPFRRALEAIQGVLSTERKQAPANSSKGSCQLGQTFTLTNSCDRQWRPSEIKLLPGLTTQSILTNNVDAVCASMQHVGHDVFRRSSVPRKRPSEPSSTPSSNASRQSFVSRQSKRSDDMHEKLESAMAHSRLAMRDRLSVHDTNSISNPASRESSSSSTRSQDNSTCTTSTASTTVSKADWMAMSVDSEEATRTMLLFLQKARLDVDRSREKRMRVHRGNPHGVNGKSQVQDAVGTGVGETTTATSDKKHFKAMLCREGRHDPSGMNKHESKEGKDIGDDGLQSAGQLKNGKLKMKIFRPGHPGEIKLGEALKAGRLHVSVGLG